MTDDNIEHEIEVGLDMADLVAASLSANHWSDELERAIADMKDAPDDSPQFWLAFQRARKALDRYGAAADSAEAEVQRLKG